MRLAIILFFLLSGSDHVKAQNGFPDYWTVVNKFFSLYHHEGNAGSAVGFALKNDGWHILTVNPMQGEKIMTDQLFFSKQKGRYQVLENFLRATEDPLIAKALAYINSSTYQAYGYARCPYYGYNGWDADLIEDFGDNDNADDTLLEALARAHSAYASRYLWYQYGGYDLGNDSLQRKLGRLELPGNERVKLFAQHIEKSTGLYRKIYDRNKNYETFTGNIARKYFLENFHGYLQLMICNRPAEAATFLAKCSLPGYDSVTAMNLLHSIGENGILFTFGDIDTYSVQYLQLTYNIRKDVAVVNTSLLGLPAYLEYLKRNNVVQFAAGASEYGRKDFDFSVYYPQTANEKRMPLDRFLAGYKNLRRVLANNGDSLRVHDAKYLYMLSPRTGSTSKTDTIMITTRDFMPMNEYLLYDIVSANFKNRPLYFSDYYEEFPVQHMEISGIVLQLGPRTSSYMGIDASIAGMQESYVKTKYITPPFQELKEPNTYNYMVNKHIDLFTPLIKFKLRKGDKAAAIDLIRQCIAPFGDDPPYVGRIDSLAPLLYENGFETMGDKIFSIYAASLMKFRREKIFIFYQDDNFIRERIKELEAILKKYNRNANILQKVN